jgi:hypothetical protein
VTSPCKHASITRAKFTAPLSCWSNAQRTRLNTETAHSMSNFLQENACMHGKHKLSFHARTSIQTCKFVACITTLTIPQQAASIGTRDFYAFGLSRILPVNLGLQLCKLHGDMRCVAIQHRCVASMNLSRMVQDDDLRHAGRSTGLIAHLHALVSYIYIYIYMSLWALYYSAMLIRQAAHLSVNRQACRYTRTMAQKTPMECVPEP